MSNLTCPKCGCEDVIPLAPCQDPVDCPTPQKCIEAFDADCITYTGTALSCKDAVIIPTDTSLTNALKALVDLACTVRANQPLVEIVEDSPNVLEAVVTGGRAPYFFKWSIEQGTFTGHSISGSNTLQSLTLNTIPGNTLKIGGIGVTTGALYMSHVKLIVTDAVGTEITRYYNYATE